MKTYRYIVAAFIATAFMSVAGCKKNNQSIQRLQNIVEKINETPGSALSSGMTLTKCEFKDGDSIFTYYIKVNDNRFESADQNEIKDSISKELNGEKMQKLVKILIDNDLNLQYVFDTKTKVIPIVFSTDDLRGSLNK